MAKTKSTEINSDSVYPSVAALAAEIHMCERSTRDAIRRNEIPHIRCGKRIILPKAAISKWLAEAGGSRA